MSNAEVRAMRVFYTRRYGLWMADSANRRLLTRKFIEQLMHCADEPARRLLLGRSR